MLVKLIPVGYLSAIISGLSDHNNYCLVLYDMKSVAKRLIF
jgi:hypothetical protein